MLANRIRHIHSHAALLRPLPPFEEIKSKFSFVKETNKLDDVKSSGPKENVTVNGWIENKPKKVGKNLTFATLRDQYGSLIQVVDVYSLLKHAQVEDAVQVTGNIVPKKTRSDNPEDKQYELQVTNLVTLNRSNRKPSQLLDFKKAGNYPPEYRYLQLRLPQFQKRLQARNEAAMIIRNLLNKHEFTEVETPLLFKSTPEGAREYLVPTRLRSAGVPQFYALPQSPQQYKQLLMASGVKNYYQIARCFRDEDLRSDRQPEFTQVDLEMSFAGSRDVMNVVEKLVRTTWNQISSTGELHTLDNENNIVPITNDNPARILTYQQAMTEYGIDKPNLKFADLKIVDLSKFGKNSANHEYSIIEALVLRNACKSLEDYKQHWSHLTNPVNYKNRVPSVIPIISKDTKATWFNMLDHSIKFENPSNVTEALDLKLGDIICFSTRQPSQKLFENPTPMGRLRQLVTKSELGKRLYQNTQADVAAWVVDFPLFSPVEVPMESKTEYPTYLPNAFSATHHPFTMVQLQDYQKLETDPLACLGQHYDLVVNGVELGGGSTRIHDPELQRYIFKEILKINNQDEIFGHLLNAFAMGTPPHAGFAIGFDRMMAMMCGTDSIRDVIAFPKSVTGSDLVIKSPSSVSEEVLKEYNISQLSGKK
ncbi:HCL502Wp [Eremothecium sinecaudum]|uniref:HCL502Wp n=1 Tax=Eremothecium sinecaudum TaxID=45286 RepID=A0A120K1R1_9SACH|nr:HCL502Wp [Eremothecium sinecaudum]AMD19649.1 HCL502Wp [Eremothecium sinecaudum]